MKTNKHEKNYIFDEELFDQECIKMAIEDRLKRNFNEVKWYLIATIEDDLNDAFNMNREDLIIKYAKQGRFKYYPMDMADIEKLTDMERLNIFVNNMHWFAPDEQEHCCELFAMIIVDSISRELC